MTDTVSSRPVGATAPTDTACPHETLTHLYRTGRLAAEYHRVRRLVQDAEAERLHGIGQLLARLDTDEVLRHHPRQPVVKVAVTGHGTVASLIPPLTVELARHGLLSRPYVADFDSYVFELSDPGSELFRSAPDLALCVLDPHVVLDELPVPWGPDDVERVLAEKLDHIERLATRFESACGGTLVVNTMPLLRETTAQLVAGGQRARLSALWYEAAGRLLRLPERHPSVAVIDLGPLIAEGVAVRDPRLSTYAKAHLSQELLAAYAREAGHLARHITGRTKKCLLVDLDGTLWGGILGDDGPDGIEIGEGHRGEAFHAFQKAVKQLSAQGVLLAAVSKNDIEPVRRVLREHPGMVLGEDDFVRVVANWQPKHENIRALAEELNLATDSFVFADDSAYECGLVRRELPEVEVVRLGQDPALHAPALLRDGWFDVRELTGEDRQRTVKYREELARQDFLHTFSSLRDYLRELRTEVHLGAVTEEQIARVSQITLRTNQFNLTAQRLQVQDVRRLAADPGHLVLAIRCADRFGSNGLVGAVIYRREGDIAHLDNFLLSCRVFSRGIEDACLTAVLRHARATGVRAVHATYRRTAKNAKVRAFYPRAGFTETADDGAEARFRHDLAEIGDVPDHLRFTEDFEGNRP
ncbi:HAD-IIIC family phosphatase [Streptomyces achromogenes]|uniref:HAD-IIIC family phosphatase n=1 Tax=Streptomyces achromogenes TaxID=67255 RepID=UPI003702C78E